MKIRLIGGKADAERDDSRSTFAPWEHFDSSEWEFDELPQLLTVKEVAGIMRVPFPTVYYLIQRGQIPAIQVGGRWRVQKRDLNRGITESEFPLSDESNQLAAC